MGGGYGLSYRLVNVKFSDTVGSGELDVIKGSRGNKLVDAKTQKTAAVGDRIKFRFMSFGFEDNTDQNFMDAKCKLCVRCRSSRPRDRGTLRGPTILRR